MSSNNQPPIAIHPNQKVLPARNKRNINNIDTKDNDSKSQVPYPREHWRRKLYSRQRSQPSNVIYIDYDPPVTTQAEVIIPEVVQAEVAKPVTTQAEVIIPEVVQAEIVNQPCITQIEIATPVMTSRNKPRNPRHYNPRKTERAKKVVIHLDPIINSDDINIQEGSPIVPSYTRRDYCNTRVLFKMGEYSVDYSLVTFMCNLNFLKLCSTQKIKRSGNLYIVDCPNWDKESFMAVVNYRTDLLKNKWLICNKNMFTIYDIAVHIGDKSIIDTIDSYLKYTVENFNTNFVIQSNFIRFIFGNPIIYSNGMLYLSQTKKIICAGVTINKFCKHLPIKSVKDAVSSDENHIKIYYQIVAHYYRYKKPMDLNIALLAIALNLDHDSILDLSEYNQPNNFESNDTFPCINFSSMIDTINSKTSYINPFLQDRIDD
jgi:hypothetical protein